MKKYIYLIISAVVYLFLNACSGDGEDKPDTGKGTGQVALYFDHGINGDRLVINGGSDFTYTSVGGEKLQDIEALDYVISNIALTDESGKDFNYSKDSLFIVSAEMKETKIVLKKIPTRKYTSITFGIGVPYKKWSEGREAQEDFYDKAYGPPYNIAWTWASGYKHLRFEGSVPSKKEDGTDFYNLFKVHIGDHINKSKKTLEQDNYRKITCPFHSPESTSLEEGKTITIHFAVDAGKILNGKNKIKLSDYNFDIMFDLIDKKIADNFTDGMFRVDHVESYDAH